MTATKPVYEIKGTPWTCPRCGGGRGSQLHKLCAAEKKRRDEHPDDDDLTNDLEGAS